ncbi:hypothetical protein ACQCN2_00160 [Brevibacillus ginsengisoli]|uniref:hypothetical protein n=1 Tax=Brevibacillus ginsengisoli TaxID=363854 RepID=UPI003CE86927
MMIDILVINELQWFYDGQVVSPAVQNVFEAKYYENVKRVVALVGDNWDRPEYLIGFDLEGNQVFSAQSPQGFLFEYLTSHQEADIAVICGVVDIEQGNEAWSDFYFAVNDQTGELNKISPAR